MALSRSLSLLALLFCLFAFISASIATKTQPAVKVRGCSGHVNDQPIFENPPTFLRSASNGKLYAVNDVSPPLFVLHVYGTPYQMGYAHGTLLKEQINQMVPQVFSFMYEQADEYLEWMPDWLRKLIEDYGVEAALEATILLTEEYTPDRFTQEIKGMADASGVSYSKLYQIMMLPELIKASCSMFGAWGRAIANTTGTLYQLRALDWSTNGPFQQWPLVTVYHPSQSDGHTFATLSWAGFVGAITGYSSSPLGLCEKVWLSYNHTSNRIGIPFHFLLRDILQFDNTMDDAIMRIEGAERTCSIWIGLSDYTRTFKAIGYSYEEVLVYDDRNFPTWTGHPNMQDLVYIDKHVQPSSDPCMGSLLQQYYGDITPERTIRYITSQFQTGDMHIAIYDFAQGFMYVANASPYMNGKSTPAYYQPFVMLDMNKLFAETL